jgi:altronate dehydratase small subunit
MRKRVYLLHPEDSVAVALDDLKPGEHLSINVKGKTLSMVVRENIPFGHKIAVKDIRKKERIVKYGEDIGCATQDINQGEWVHSHNITSERGKSSRTGV